MKTNHLFNETDPTSVIVDQIMERSGICNNLYDSIYKLKEELDRTKDKKTLLKLNEEMTLKLAKMAKIKEYTEYIHETFRTIPSLSARLQEAETYFYEGKFTEMDETLDAGEIRAEIEVLEAELFGEEKVSDGRKEEIRALLQKKSYELTVKALYGYTFIENKLWYESVFELLSDAHDASYNMHAYYEFASYLLITDEQNWALEVAEDGYVYARDTEGEACRLYEAKCLWAMGVIAKKKKDYRTAVEHAGKALKIYTGLMDKNPAEYRPKMSNMLVIMGEYHLLMENFAVSLVVFEEALKVRRELALYGNPESLMQLADVLDKLSCVHLCLKEHPEAIRKFEEALKIKDDNLDFNLYHVLKSKADTLHNLSIAHYSMHEYEKALRRAKEELDVRREVQEIDPFGQLSHIAATRKMLGDIYLQLNRPDEAVVEREQVVKLYKTLVKHFPDNGWLPHLGVELNHCCNLYYHKKMYGKYILGLKEAIEIFRKLALDNPDEYLMTVGCLLSNVCHFYETISPDKKKMLEAATEAYRILSSIDRHETAETVYTKLKKMLGIKD